MLEERTAPEWYTTVLFRFFTARDCVFVHTASGRGGHTLWNRRPEALVNCEPAGFAGRFVTTLFKARLCFLVKRPTKETDGANAKRNIFNPRVIGSGFSCISSALLVFVAYSNTHVRIWPPRPVVKFQREHKECADIPRKYTDMIVVVLLWHALSHFFFGVGFVAALDPERPFSVLSIPDEVTRHSLLQRRGRDG